MSTKAQRINVTLDEDVLEIIHLLAKKKHMSMSAIIKKMVDDWLEEYEEMKLIQKIEERESENNKYITHEEFWKE